MKLPFSRFQFSLRTMFVIVTLVAVLCGYQMNWIRQREEFIKRKDVNWLANEEHAAALPLGLRLFGEPAYAVISIEDAPAEIEEEAKGLFPEAEFRSDGHTMGFNGVRNFLIGDMEDHSVFERVVNFIRSLRHRNPAVRPPASQEPRLP